MANVSSTIDPNDISPTHFEDLSNEFFYEIFEYLDGSDIFNGFSNLNNRFSNLINCSSLPLRFHVNSLSRSDFQHLCTKFINPNKYRIVSFHLCDRAYHSSYERDWSPLCIIDSLFQRLESLFLDRIRSRHSIIPLFPTLIALPRLFVITIHLTTRSPHLPEIYPLVFRLPLLRKSEILAEASSYNLSRLMNANDQYSPIKCLIISHSCVITQLIAILSYTPQLRHLTCRELSQSYEHVTDNLSIKMFNLTNITINMCHVEFDEFEIFIKEICSQLRVLCFNTSEEMAYLDATRWERLISQYMPYLYKFEFQYSDRHYKTLELTSYHDLSDRFASSFWINRGWYLEITTDVNYWPPTGIIYTIRPYSKTWHEIYEQEKKDKYTNQEEVADVKLIINHLGFPKSQQRLVDDIFCFINRSQITRLEIDCRKLLFLKFLNLLHVLPNLNSLRILFWSSLKLKHLSPENVELVSLWSRRNRITNLELEGLKEEIEIDEVQFFIDHCPQMKYFQVKCKGNFNIESIVRHILIQNIDKISKLCLLCVWVPIADNKMIKQLQRMMDFEKIIHDYKVLRSSDRIYLQRDSFTHKY